MSNEIRKPAGPDVRRITLPYIGRYLKEAGLDATRREKSFFVDLGFESGLMVGLNEGALSVAVTIPTDEEHADMALAQANLTMASTTMTKVFLQTEEDDMSMWFAVESFCRTRSEFDKIIEQMLNMLLNSVKMYFSFKEELLETENAGVLLDFLSAQCGKGHVC